MDRKCKPLSIEKCITVLLLVLTQIDYLSTYMVTEYTSSAII